MNRRKNQKKQNHMRRMAAAMAIVIAAGMAGTCGYQRSLITAQAAEVDTKELTEAAENALNLKNGEKEESGINKEESVYVKTDSSGNVKTTTVTEWLKNPGTGTVSDVSELEGIKNIKGDEAFNTSGDQTLDWQAVGDDIYYQGTTQKKLPVGVNISYKLDGKDISAEELKGKDGKVEIHIQYTNNSSSEVQVNGQSEEMFTPFTMITAMMLPADEYQNVEIDHGKVVSDAEREIVVGMGFPGLNENLKLTDEEFELPEEVTITADVKNASVGPTITIATTEYLQNLNLDEIDSFDDLSVSIDELKDATNQLVDGSKEAADGAGELAEGAKTLADGTGSLVAGAGELKSGTGALVTGTKTLTSKMPELVSGVEALDNGAGSLESGIGTLQSSIDHKKQSEADQSGLLEGAGTLQAGITSYTDGIDQLKNSMEQGQMVAGANNLSQGAQSVSAGVQQVSQGLGTLKAQTAAAANTTALTNALNTFSASVSQITATPVAVNGFAISKTVGEVVSTESLQTALASTNLTEEQKAAVMNAIQNLSGTIQITTDDINQAIDQGAISAQANAQSVARSGAAAQAVGEEADKIATAAGTADSIAANLQGAMSGNGTAENPGLVAGAAGVAMGAENLSTGVSQVKSGVDNLATYNQGLKDGSGAIFAGMQQVSAGVGKLAAGAGQLKDGTSELKSGAGALVAGAQTLGEGVNALDEGAGSLKDGADQLNTGAGTLSDGAQALAEGNQALAEGMAEYKTEAIDKLTDLFDGDISKVTDRVKVMTELGKDYKSFAGIRDDMNGITRFIIETEGVNE